MGSRVRGRVRITIHFDGAAQPNPGRMGIGAVLEGPDGIIKEISETPDGPGTSNMAEYHAVIRALEEAKAAGGTEIRLMGDSNLVIQQLSGRFRVTDGKLRPLYEKISKLSYDFESFDLQWIPREKNKRADALAYQAATGKPRGASAKPGSKPDKREHSILCPTCKKPCTIRVQKFKDGTEHLRQECPDHGFVAYAPNVEPFLSLAKEPK